MSSRENGEDEDHVLDETNDGFNNWLAKFHMALAEDKLLEATQALHELRSSTLLPMPSTIQSSSASQDSTHLVKKEMLADCERRFRSGYTEALLDLLKKSCQDGQDAQVFLLFETAKFIGSEEAASIIFANYLQRMFKQRTRTSIENCKAKKAAGRANRTGYANRQGHIEALGEIMGDASNIFATVTDLTTNDAIQKRILEPIHTETLQRCLEVIQMFIDDARITSWERRAREQAQQQRGSEQQVAHVESDESVQTVDLLLDELCFINNLLERYQDYAKSHLEASTDDSKKFAKQTQELGGVYILLERFYIFQTCHKAIEIAEPQEIEPNVYVSSMVEDASFVLEKAFSRASTSLNYHNTLAIVIAIIDIIESRFLPAILHLPNTKMLLPLLLNDEDSSIPSRATHDEMKTKKRNQPNLPFPPRNESDALDAFSDLLAKAVDEDLTASLHEEAKLIVAINSAFASAEYISRIETLVKECSLYSFPNDPFMLDCVPKSFSEIVEDFKSVVSHGIDALFMKSWWSQLQKHLAASMDRMTYQLTLKEYEVYEVQSSVLETFLHHVLEHSMLRRCQRMLNKMVFDEWVMKLSKLIVSEVEKWILTKTFNDWGAMLLEKEVRSLLTGFASLLVKGTIRSHFARLDQIVLVLNLMRPSDLMHYATIVNHLSVAEIEAILRLQIKFTPESIQGVIAKLRSQSTPAST